MSQSETTVNTLVNQVEALHLDASLFPSLSPKKPQITKENEIKDETKDTSICEQTMSPTALPLTISPKFNYNDGFVKNPIYYLNIKKRVYIPHLVNAGALAGHTIFRIQTDNGTELSFSLRHQTPYCRVEISRMWRKAISKRAILLNAKMTMCMSSAAYNPFTANEYGQDKDMVNYFQWREMIRQELICEVRRNKSVYIHIDEKKLKAPVEGVRENLIALSCKPSCFQDPELEINGKTTELEMLKQVTDVDPYSIPPSVKDIFQDLEIHPSFFWVTAPLYLPLRQIPEEFDKLCRDDQNDIWEYPLFKKLLITMGVIPNPVMLLSGPDLTRVPLSRREIKKGDLVSVIDDMTMFSELSSESWGLRDSPFIIFMMARP